MGWSLRAGEIGASGGLGGSISVLFIFAIAAASPAQAQAPTPTPVPLPNSEISATAGLADLGGNFLGRLYRTWGDVYGISTRSGPLLDFVGDRRQTAGGVAGIGARISPGVNVGFSVDQSRTDMDVPLVMQSAGLNLTQLGFNVHPSRASRFKASAKADKGADPGASVSVSLSNMVRIYLNYDGKFRAALQSNQGTVGLELPW